MKSYALIAADPPWPFGDKLSGKRGAASNYKSMMTIEAIAGMARGAASGGRVLAGESPTAIALCGKKFRIADDAILALWRVASMQREALDVMDAWGFGEPKTELVWLKTTGEPSRGVAVNAADYGRQIREEHFFTDAKMHFGMGHSLRACHETCLIGARGRYLSLIESRSIRSVFYAPVPRDANGKVIHSAKPPQFFRLLEELVGDVNRLELFAREKRGGWKCVGNEVKA